MVAQLKTISISITGQGHSIQRATTTLQGRMSVGEYIKALGHISPKVDIATIAVMGMLWTTKVQDSCQQGTSQV